MNAINKLLNIALNEVGYLEKSSPRSLDSKTANAGKGNYTKYARDMMEISAPIYVNGYAWCDTFVDWCFVKAFGAVNTKKLICDWSAYTPTSAGFYKNNGRWYKSPERGDQIFFKNKSGVICHTGFVYDVDAHYVYTVEGNTSSASGVVANGGSVARKKYDLNYWYIAGYGRPDYSIVEEEEPMHETEYNWTLACPEWTRPYVQKALDNGYIKGDDKGALHLTDTKIWCLVVMMRMMGIME